ncbi:MAG: beta-ketoacyl synthase chain length factor [Neisseria sp.]|nr:beta-ketoacyl synthase chain length factor [Neisseria sp.]
MSVQPSCRFSFRIADWRALGGRMADEAQWRLWAEDAAAVQDLPEYKPALAFLPPLQRRRLGAAARLICDAAWPLAQAFPDMPLVYASHDGEINRSFELWLELFKSGSVSPTSFGLSVHNAPAGQWSMLRADMSESTALAVSADGLETALAECYALLQEGTSRVLLLLADEPLKTDYAVHACRAPFAYALALVLEAGDEYELSLMPSENSLPDSGGGGKEVADYWGALDWLRFMLRGDAEYVRQANDRGWLWRKKR